MKVMGRGLMDTAMDKKPLTEELVRELMLKAGARVRSRGGRSDHYGSPREFSFEVKGIFDNGMMLHVVARQYTYRDPWEAPGRINDVVDVFLLRKNLPSELPKGFVWFQGRDDEKDIDASALTEMVQEVRAINPKLYVLQQLSGDM